MAPGQTEISTYFQQRKHEPRVTRSKTLQEKLPVIISQPVGWNIEDKIQESPRTRAKVTVAKNNIVESETSDVIESACKTPSKPKDKSNKDQGCSTHDIESTPAKSPSKRKNKVKEPPSPPKIMCKGVSPACCKHYMTAGSAPSTPSTLLKDLSQTSPNAKTGAAPATPSTLLKGLSLDSPVNKPNSEPFLSPKSLFPESDDKLGKARIALHTHARTSLPGREEELKQLNSFIQNHLESRTSGSLYISGPPGTGKTACLTKILDQHDLQKKCKVININCTSIESPKAVYSRIAAQLGLKVGNKSGKAYLESITNYLKSAKKMIFMVLDEMDQLDTRSSSVLYTIFEWPIIYKSSIILIGIANALDLTDRMLPRLKAKLQLAPQLLHFAPYTKQQLLNIFSQRLEEGDALHLFHPAALQLLASKVSAVNGDARRALDTARRTVEKESQRMFDLERDQLVLGKLQSSPSKGVSKMKPVTDANLIRMSPRKAMSVISSQHLGAEKQSGKSPLKTKSPLKSPSKSPLKSPLKSPTRALNSPLKENCSPEKPRSAKKCLFNQSDAGTTLPGSKNLAPPTGTEPCIGVKSIMNIVNDVYGSSQCLGRTADGGEELPLHHKFAICSLLLILREGKSKDVTVGKLHDVYRRVCTKRHMEPLDSGAFLCMLGLIEARGIVLLPGRGKRGRLTKVCMQWIEDEVVAALKDRDLLASILKDRGCLS